jgi:hypothetical protein
MIRVIIPDIDGFPEITGENQINVRKHEASEGSFNSNIMGI